MQRVVACKNNTYWSHIVTRGTKTKIAQTTARESDTSHRANRVHVRINFMDLVVVLQQQY